MRISDWSSDVCSSDLLRVALIPQPIDLLPQPPSLGIGRQSPYRGEQVLDVGPFLQSQSLPRQPIRLVFRSEEHTSELQSLMRISYAVFCLKNKIHHTYNHKQSNSIQQTFSRLPL